MKSERLHVFHVVRCGLATGGMENGIINVANRLDPERFRISICALDERETFSSRIRLPETGYHLLPKRGDGIDWALILRLARQLRKSRADVVFSHNWGSFLYSVLAARLAGKPIIHGEHGKNLAELGEQNPAKDRMKRLLGRRVSRVLAVSRNIQQEWTETYRVPAARVTWIPNGVDTVRFAPGPADRAAFGLPRAAFLLGSVGRLDPIKNYSFLLRLTRVLAVQIPHLHLVLAGDGPCLEPLREEARSLGITGRVSFLGTCHCVEKLLPALDLFLLPSLGEGMSNTVLEAMASGLPVVCYDLPAHREIIQPDSDGMLLSPCTEEVFAPVVAGLACNAERRSALGAAARQTVCRKFGLDSMLKRYQEMFLEVVK
jgi:sugar transferase (PEP-CTERM/EpsH1 system associated)